MEAMMDRFTVGGRQVWLWQPRTPERNDLPLVLVPAGEDAEEEMKQVFTLAEESVQKPFRLAAFASADWNRDYSPWPAPALFKKEPPFAGDGPDTLAWLRKGLLPELARRNAAVQTPESTTLLGYSLAGLFALWAFYESGLFGAVASCSGSLWFDGWLLYLEKKRAPAGGRVYLSLGDREEKARNPRMAAVGEATRRTSVLLWEDENLAASTLVWQPGGHFDGVPRRLADALVWLLA